MKGILSALLGLGLIAAPAAVTAQADAAIRNDFINDLAYYADNYAEFEHSNWRFCCGDMEQFFDMTYCAPQRSFVGTEAYCEIHSNGILHPGTNELTMVLWTAPCGGTLNLTATAQKLDHSAEGDPTALLIYDPAGELAEEMIFAVDDYDERTFTAENVTVEAGDTYYFCIDYVGNNYFDRMYLDVKTELTDLVAAPSAPETPESPETQTDNKGCAGSLTAGAGIVLIAGAGAAAVIKKRKR